VSKLQLFSKAYDAFTAFTRYYMLVYFGFAQEHMMFACTILVDDFIGMESLRKE